MCMLLVCSLHHRCACNDAGGDAFTDAIPLCAHSAAGTCGCPRAKTAVCLSPYPALSFTATAANCLFYPAVQINLFAFGEKGLGSRPKGPLDLGAGAGALTGARAGTCAWAGAGACAAIGAGAGAMSYGTSPPASRDTATSLRRILLRKSGNACKQCTHACWTAEPDQKLPSIDCS